jgi:hydrogenase nickel incorporation protein HypA/HybF
MHEMHLAQDILRKIQEQAKGKVTYAKIALGASRFTHMQELLELFADISGGIKLEIEILPVKTACADCHTEFNPKAPRLTCEKCGSSNIQLISGNELIIRELA